MKISELRSRSTEDLVLSMKDLSRESFNLRFQRANGVLEKSSRIREVRRDIARVKMLLSGLRRKKNGE